MRALVILGMAVAALGVLMSTSLIPGDFTTADAVAMTGLSITIVLAGIARMIYEIGSKGGIR